MTGCDVVVGRAQGVFALPSGPTAHGRTRDQMSAPAEGPALSPSSPWTHLAVEWTDLSHAYVEAVVGKT